MSCGKPVVDLRARSVDCPGRFTRVPPLHPRPRSWTARLGLTTNPHECTPMTTSSCTKMRSFRSSDVQSKYSILSDTASLKNHMKTRSLWNFEYGRSHFGSNLFLMCSIKGTSWLVPDLIVFDAVVFDTKVIDRITDHERGLTLNYLRITKLRVGVVLNFKHRKLEWERIVL